MNIDQAMAALLSTPLDQHLARRPDFTIGPEVSPYLERWWISRPEPADEGTDRDTGSVYLHRIHRDDPDPELHDHPWPSTSVILAGNLRELTPAGSQVLHPGSVVQRAAKDPHRLTVTAGPVLSLFITGRWERNWGFHAAQGWVPWQEFLQDNNPDRR